VLGIFTHVHEFSGTDLLKVGHFRVLSVIRESKRCGVISLVWTVQCISRDYSGFRPSVNEHFMLLNFSLDFF
jgi:hypothetical protein